MSYPASFRPLRYIPSCGKHYNQYSFRAVQLKFHVHSCFLITHAHLDHVNGLVISAGSLAGPRKRVYAMKQTLKDLESIFSDRIWPNLASWDEDDEEHKLLYSMYGRCLFTYLRFLHFSCIPNLSRLRNDNKYKTIYSDISVRTIALNHGRNQTGNYESAAFFIRHDLHNREFLFFGDVEPDTVSSKPQTINVWRAAAPKIPQKLSTIFIECSWPSGRHENVLYGHLSPDHLVDELTALAIEVVKFRSGGLTGTRPGPPRKKKKNNPISQDDLRGTLDGLRVYVMHCKDDLNGDAVQSMRHVIVPQVRGLVEGKGLGAQILVVEPGMLIGTSSGLRISRC
jgi:ribonuclease BN (tRNA processing enzyme)